MTSKPTTIEEHNAKVEATLAAFAAANAAEQAIAYKERISNPEKYAYLEVACVTAWNKHENAKARRTIFLRNA